MDPSGYDHGVVRDAFIVALGYQAAMLRAGGRRLEAVSVARRVARLCREDLAGPAGGARGYIRAVDAEMALASLLVELDRHAAGRRRYRLALSLVELLATSGARTPWVAARRQELLGLIDDPADRAREA